MTQQEEKIFNETVEVLAQSYPNRDIKMIWDYDRWVISVDGEVRFTTKEYNFLYNMTRLVNCLEYELR